MKTPIRPRNIPLHDARLDHRTFELWLGSESWRRVPVWRALLTDADPRRNSDGHSECPSFPAPARATVWRTAHRSWPSRFFRNGIRRGSLFWSAITSVSTPHLQKPANVKDLSALYVRDPRGQPFLTALAFLSRGLTHRFPGPNGRILSSDRIS